MIATLHGASGAGKTTIARALLARFSGAEMIVSYTTREPRENDIPGEYRYISEARFKTMEFLKLFLWTVGPHGNRYGTLRLSLRMAFLYDNDLRFMILHDRLPNLLAYAKEYGQEDRIIPFYIISPGQEILRNRLIERGDNEFQVAKRIKDCERWDSMASSSGLPYIFVKNDGKIDFTVDRIEEILIEKMDEFIF